MHLEIVSYEILILNCDYSYVVVGRGRTSCKIHVDMLNDIIYTSKLYPNVIETFIYTQIQKNIFLISVSDDLSNYHA